MSITRSTLLAAAVIFTPAILTAQTAVETPKVGVAGDCEGGVAQPATGVAQGPSSGTAPGNAGSTGWSGGTGGSNTGTVPAGALPESKTWQPKTASGLDLMGVKKLPPDC
ncbi:hypothetical protein CG51_00905 [Haematobacter missouriensis]|uniref:Uncharacterized protein n=1 Tax=Haematobacter missouriensis TaxID=366616 RepID=A0A212AJT9_9RHOB|nr:hypothetical protein [Haematobacter missouriensis]KFI32513.1 hypothetical protein CG51_00905 [Haematobacter missouriensis]OWJ70247.1 hypothetical protein CDV53_21085 [Haematobacter missouriensis]OWJ81685.1 hypothetical protein CDV52_17090 [Haematobacter missouriensis]